MVPMRDLIYRRSQSLVAVQDKYEMPRKSILISRQSKNLTFLEFVLPVNVTKTDVNLVNVAHNRAKQLG